MTKLIVAFRSFANAPKDDWEVETVATRWLIIQDTDWYQQGVEKLLQRYDKYEPHLWRRRFGKVVELPYHEIWAVLKYRKTRNSKHDYVFYKL